MKNSKSKRKHWENVSGTQICPVHKCYYYRYALIQTSEAKLATQKIRQVYCPVIW